MTLPRNSRWRFGVALATLAAAFALALNVPIPTAPDVDRARVMAEVGERLPGWRVKRLHPSWEGAYSVVTACAGHEIGFQFVPGHGLPIHDAWLQPTDDYSRDRLRLVSDHWRQLVWYGSPVATNSLSCSDEVAGRARTSMESRRHD